MGAIAGNSAAITANTETIAGNSAVISTNTSAITTNSESIEGTASDVADLTGRVETNEGDIETLTSDVSGVTTRVTTNESQIAAQSVRNSNQDAAIALNASTGLENAGLILANTKALADTNDLVRRNFRLIGENTQSITKLEGGLASVAALPDMYISPNAKWSAAGGLGFYGDEVGVGATLAIRGNDNWAFGASIAKGGDAVSGKLQARYEGF
jgi:hypothetical protein